MYYKIKIYLKQNNIDINNFRKGKNREFEIKDVGEGSYISFWDNVAIGIAEPTTEQLAAISDNEAEKERLIPLIKEEASKRILEIYPTYKQINALADFSRIRNREIKKLRLGESYALTADDLAKLDQADVMDQAVLNIRTKSNALEASLNGMTLEQLSSFNPSLDSHWL